MSVADTGGIHPLCHASLERDFFETGAALVVKEGIVHLVIGDEEIQQAILIVVRHSDSHSLSRMGPDSRFFRNVAEGPVSIVQKQLVGGLVNCCG
jgi:hypothetical protein